ncbi:MAG: hypothetical protein AAGJ70_07550 [Pseudomonadota bacterium]
MIRIAAILLATVTLVAVTTMSAQPALAQEKKSQAKAWNLVGEVKTRFDARVVDILCELSGTDCAEQCAGGTVQLGLVRKSDGKLFPVLKNGQPNFAGAVDDLLPYCNQDVEVDGLMVGEGPIKHYQLQLIRKAGAAKWSKANNFTKVWRKERPDDAKKKGAWFRRDGRIAKQIAADGWLGLGAEADKAYAKSELE